MISHYFYTFSSSLLPSNCSLSSEKDSRVSRLASTTLVHLIVFSVGLLGQESGLLQLVLEGLHPLLVGDAPVLKHLAHTGQDLIKEGKIQFAEAKEKKKGIIDHY